MVAKLPPYISRLRLTSAGFVAAGLPRRGRLDLPRDSVASGTRLWQTRTRSDDACGAGTPLHRHFRHKGVRHSCQLVLHLPPNLPRRPTRLHGTSRPQGPSDERQPACAVVRFRRAVGDLRAPAVRTQLALHCRPLAAVLAADRQLRDDSRGRGRRHAGRSGAGPGFRAAPGAVGVRARGRRPGSVLLSRRVLPRLARRLGGCGRCRGSARRELHTAPRRHLLGTDRSRIRAGDDHLRTAPNPAEPRCHADQPGTVGLLARSR